MTVSDAVTMASDKLNMEAVQAHFKSELVGSHLTVECLDFNYGLVADSWEIQDGPEQGEVEEDLIKARSLA